MNLQNDLSKQTGGTAPSVKRAPQPEWLARLWANQRVPLGPEKLYWWGVQVQSFLSLVRRQQLDGPVEVLAARFLDEVVLDRPLGNLGDTVRAKRAGRLPVVLSREEVQRVLQGMEGTLGLIARLL